MRILVVEDEAEMASLLASIVGEAGFVVDVVGSIGDALEASRQRDYGVILLDRRLPDGDGVSRLREFRALRPSARIIMVSALDALTDKVGGLDAGADDYLTKPFQSEELLARIRACLRRPAGEALPPLALGALSLDLASREVAVEGRPCAFNRRELMLLQAMMCRANRVATRESLMEEVYGLQDDVQANTLDSLVARLRRRLESLNARIEVHTVRGIGYMLTEAPR
jgi:two-component system OmpR family response regulator